MEDARFAEQSRFGCVRFDRRRGMGNTPNGTDIDYFGATVLMRPSVYLSLAAPLEYSRDTFADLCRRVAEGAPVAPADLDVSPSDPGRAGFWVHGHDGRHRMMAVLRAAGDAEVPVGVRIRFERARNWTSETVAALRSGMYRQSLSDRLGGGDHVAGPLFGDACLMGRILGAEPEQKSHMRP